MKAVDITENSSIIVKEVNEPSIGSGDVLIKLNGCGICGTDKENLDGDSSKPSTKLGHEICGTVLKKGQNVNAEISEGMRVFVHHHTHCNECHYCLHGNHTMCEKYQDSLDPCGMSEKFVLPEWNVLNGCLIPLCDSISNEEGVLIEPLGCCVRAWSKIKAVKNDSCIIFGMGTIGIMHAMLAKYYKFNQIFCVDVNKEKLEICKKMDLGHGINSTIENFDNIKKLTNNQGVDLIIIATSDIGILKQAVELVRKGGKIMLFGQPKKYSLCEIDMSQVYSKEITIHTTYAASNEDIRIAIDLIQNHSINVKNLVTHKFSIKDSKEAFECAIKNNNSIKVMITGA